MSKFKSHIIKEYLTEFGYFDPKNRKPPGKGVNQGGPKDTKTPEQHLNLAIKNLKQALKSTRAGDDEVMRDNIMTAVMELTFLME